MEKSPNKLKLKAKQHAILTDIQVQKQQLSKLFQELNEKEVTLLTVIFESADVNVEKVKNVKLEADYIVYEEEEQVEK
jgi:fructose-bisphosphate aldolase class 1